MSKLKSKKCYLILLCSVVYFISYFSRKDFAVVMAGMISSGVVDKITCGTIETALFITYGLGQLISGFLGDRLKPSYLIFFGLGTTALCNFLLPFMPNGYAMIPVWAVNGFAQAMLWPPIVRILSDNLDSERFVRANFLVTSAAHFSTVILYLYVPVCLLYFDWKTVFFSATVLAVLAIVLFVVSLILILPKDAVKSPAPKTEKVLEKGACESYFSLLRRSGILYIFVCIIMMGFLKDGIESWFPTLYSEAFGRDASESILLSVALPVFAIVAISATTALHKTRFFKNETLGAIIFFVTVMLLALPIVFLITSGAIVSRVICLVLTCTICACMQGCNFLFISCLPGHFSKYGKAATTSGICNTFTYVGAAICSYTMALISKIFNWRASIISWVIVAGIGVLFALLALRSYTNFIKIKTDSGETNENSN
ncbi:MAG: MFS transporter [Ruminococcaceae bacterium]|nr:MFS transporter [Oscillospiraceae bacterium]